MNSIPALFLVLVACEGPAPALQDPAAGRAEDRASEQAQERVQERTLPPLPDRRHGHRAVRLDDGLVVLGGYRPTADRDQRQTPNHEYGIWSRACVSQRGLRSSGRDHQPRAP